MKQALQTPVLDDSLNKVSFCLHSQLSSVISVNRSGISVNGNTRIMLTETFSVVISVSHL